MHDEHECVTGCVGRRFGRRSLLVGGLAATAAAAIGPATRLFAQTSEDRRFVALFFNGGWDVLLGLDARDPGRSYSGIDLGTEMLAPEWRTPFPVTIGGTEVLWGAPMQALARHTDVMTLFRGVNMNTVAHPTGRAYVNTFMPPAGVVARGDSLGTRMATARSTEDLILPNVSIGIPTFNQSYGPDVTGIRVGRATEVPDLLRPLQPQLPRDVEQLLAEAQDASEGCVSPRYPAAIPADDLRVSRGRVRDLLAGGYDSEFDFASQPSLQARYGIVNPNNGNEPAVIAATVHKLIQTGLCATVTAQVQRGIDTHVANWAPTHPTLLKDGVDAVAVLLDDLRMDDPDLSRTTVVVYSEFARTPKINGSRGRDHWFANSIGVFGGGLRRGVVGATVEQTLGLRDIDLTTGLPQAGGTVLMPENIGATLAAAAGLDPSPFRVSPLNAWIEGGA